MTAHGRRPRGKCTVCGRAVATFNGRAVRHAPPNRVPWSGEACDGYGLPTDPLPEPAPTTPLPRTSRATPVENMMTAAEVAALMRVSKMTVYRLAHAGELTAYRIGRGFRIPAESFAAYLAGARVDGDEL